MARGHSGGTGYPEWEFLWRAALFFFPSPFSPSFRIKTADSTLRNVEKHEARAEKERGYGGSPPRSPHCSPCFIPLLSAYTFSLSLSLSLHFVVCRYLLCVSAVTSRFYGNSICIFVQPGRGTMGCPRATEPQGKRLFRSNLFFLLARMSSESDHSSLLWRTFGGDISFCSQEDSSSSSLFYYYYCGASGPSMI